MVLDAHGTHAYRQNDHAHIKIKIIFKKIGEREWKQGLYSQTPIGKRYSYMSEESMKNMREKWKIMQERMVEKLLKLDEFIRIIRQN